VLIRVYPGCVRVYLRVYKGVPQGVWEAYWAMYTIINPGVGGILGYVHPMYTRYVRHTGLCTPHGIPGYVRHTGLYTTLCTPRDIHHLGYTS